MIRVLEFRRSSASFHRVAGWTGGHRGIGWPWHGRAFVAKAVLNLPTTEALIDRLEANQALQRICAFEGSPGRHRDRGPGEAHSQATATASNERTADGDIPVTAILTSASLRDSQAAIPLMRLTGERVTYLYELAETAYCSGVIREVSRQEGHAPLIDNNARWGGEDRLCATRSRARTSAQLGRAGQQSLEGIADRARGKKRPFLPLSSDRLHH